MDRDFKFTTRQDQFGSYLYLYVFYAILSIELIACVACVRGNSLF